MIAGTLEIQMLANMARLQADITQGKGIVVDGMAKIESAVASAKSALDALGISIGAFEFIHFIEGGIKAEAALHGLSLQTGITVETLSALRPIANQAGTNIDNVAGMVNKLEKSMITFAQSGGGKAADAFKQLGYSQDQVKVGLQNIDTFLPQFAKRLMEAGVGGEQAGLAMQLMAKGGAAALPFLEQLVANGTLHAKVTTEQAAAAHEFEVNLVKLKAGSGELAISLANDLVPGLTKITEAMIKAKTEGNLLYVVWRGLMTTFGGDEMHKTNVDMVKQTETMLNLENQLAGARARLGEGSPQAKLLQQRVSAAKDELAATRAHWELLQHEEELKNKAAESKLRTPLADIPTGATAPGMSEHELQVYAHAVQAVKELDAAEKQRNENLKEEDAAFVKAMHEFNQFAEAQEKLLNQQAQSWKDLIDPLEPYRRQLAEIDNLYKANKLSSDEWAAAINIVSKNMREVGKVAPEVSGMMKTAAKDMQRSMSSGFFDLMQGKTHDFAASFKAMVDHIVADWLAAQAMMKLFGPDFAKTGDIGGLFGKGLSALGFGGPSYVTGGEGAASWTSGMDLPLGSFATGTDYVPRTGMYQLHEGETVTPASENDAGKRAINISMTVVTNDAGSFSRNRGQIMADMARTLDAARRNM